MLRLRSPTSWFLRRWELGQEMEEGPSRIDGRSGGNRVGGGEQEAEGGTSRSKDGDRVPEKSDGLLRKGVPVAARYAFIHHEEGRYPITMMCRCLKVSKSGYYAWIGRQPSKAAQRREELKALIEWIFNDSHGSYGYRCLHAALQRRGVQAHRDTVPLLMRALGLQASQPRAKVRTTVPAADLDSRPDLVKRDFTADKPGMKWVGDITYIRTWEGFAYLATVLGSCTKKQSGMQWPITCAPHWSVMLSTWQCPTVPARKGRRYSIPIGDANTLPRPSPNTSKDTASSPPQAGQGCVGWVPGRSRLMPL